MKKIEPLTVLNEEGEFATTEEQQIEIITSYFKKMLAPAAEPNKILQNIKDKKSFHSRRD